MKKKGVLIVGLSLVVALSLSACNKKKEVIEPSEVIATEEAVTQEDNKINSTLETDIEEIKETVVGIGEVSIEDTLKIDDIINELSSNVAKENIDLSDEKGSNASANKRAQEDADAAFEESLRESLGISEESGDNTSSVDEDVYDVDNNLNTREVEGFERETEPIIGEDGAVVETVDILIKKSKEEAYEGPTIESNNSEVMHIGSVYNYYLDSGSELGQVGDFVMCGQLAINVAPMFSVPGYNLKSYGNTVELTTELGHVYIKKLDTDSLEVEKMSAAQINKLSGLNLTWTYMNATKGSYGAYSMCQTDEKHQNAAQYYKCNFGTYEIKYASDYPETVFYLIAAVFPESSLNEVAIMD